MKRRTSKLPLIQLVQCLRQLLGRFWRLGAGEERLGLADVDAVGFACPFEEGIPVLLLQGYELVGLVLVEANSRALLEGWTGSCKVTHQMVSVCK